MTNAEKAIIAIHAATKILTHPVQNAPVNDMPATHQISGCHWDEAVNSIDLAMAELLKARKELEELQQPEATHSRGITPTQSGASQLACDIVNNTFLSLDGFAALRKQMDSPTSSYGSKAFASELARITDREIKRNSVIAMAKYFGVDSKLLLMTNEELAS